MTRALNIVALAAERFLEWHFRRQPKPANHQRQWLDTSNAKTYTIDGGVVWPPGIVIAPNPPAKHDPQLKVVPID